MAGIVPILMRALSVKAKDIHMHAVNWTGDN